MLVQHVLCVVVLGMFLSISPLANLVCGLVTNLLPFQFVIPVGDIVKKGQVLVTVEGMKMEVFIFRAITVQHIT